MYGVLENFGRDHKQANEYLIVLSYLGLSPIFSTGAINKSFKLSGKAAQFSELSTIKVKGTINSVSHNIYLINS